MALTRKDAKIPDNAPKELLLDLHQTYISKYGEDPEEYDYEYDDYYYDAEYHDYKFWYNDEDYDQAMYNEMWGKI